jgi:hypothetical protein
MLVESGEPHDLLQHSSGIFTSMVAQTGPSSSTHLREVARMASVTRVASRTGVQRVVSDVLGRRYVDNPVSEQQGSLQQQQQQQGGQWEEGAAFRRPGSEVSRYGFQVRQTLLSWQLSCARPDVRPSTITVFSVDCATVSRAVVPSRACCQLLLCTCGVR